MSDKKKRPGIKRDVAQIIGRLVHDLRNPLAAVISNLRFIEGELDDSELLEALRETIESSEILSRQLADALDLCRLADGRYRARREPVALADVAAEVLQRVSHRVGSRALELALPEKILTLDGELLTRALANLVEQSLKYTPSRKTVRLEGALAGDSLTLTLIDEGPPFDSAIDPSLISGMPSVGEPQEGCRGDSSLSLLFVGYAVAALGGEIDLSRREQGEGICFSIRLPATAC